MIKMEDMHKVPLAKTDLAAATAIVQSASSRAQLLVSKWHHSLRRSEGHWIESDRVEFLPSWKYKQIILKMIDVCTPEYTCILSGVVVFFLFLQGLRAIFVWTQDYMIYFLRVTTLNQRPMYVSVSPLRWWCWTKNTNMEARVARVAISPRYLLRKFVLLVPTLWVEVLLAFSRTRSLSCSAVYLWTTVTTCHMEISQVYETHIRPL